MQWLTLTIPTRWAVDGLDGVTWRGFSLAETLPAVLVVLLFALAFGLVALWKFRWEE
jgi:ABC-2 type transport system permease protein